MINKMEIRTSGQEAKLQAELRKMKLVAIGLLIFFAFVFIITASLDHTGNIWIGFIKATAEAAMVGAIADWFAVTALFRHPMGLKIPHTAIIPTRKDSMGRALGQFVRQNFLSREVVIEKLRDSDPSRQIAQWLTQPENSRQLANYFTLSLGAGIQVMKDDDVQELIQHSLTNQIRTMHISPVLGNLLALITSGSRRQELVHGVVNLAAQLLEDNKEPLKAKIAQETPWWLPSNVDETIYQKIIDASDQTFAEIKSDPNHTFYAKFDEVLGAFIEDLKNSPEMLVKEQSIKEDLLQDPMVKEFSSSLWADIKAALSAYQTTPNVNTRQPIEKGIQRFGQALLEDSAVLDKIDQWLEQTVEFIIKEYGHEVEHLIANTIQRWDAKETSRKIELQVGKDLQFIRINGTLVGGLVGFCIHGLSLLF